MSATWSGGALRSSQGQDDRTVAGEVGEPRAIDMDFVRARQARRTLDCLVGYGLLPLVWGKLPGCRSVGRVQWVAERLVCEREAEIEVFVAASVLDRRGGGGCGGRTRFRASLTELDGAEIGEEGSTRKPLRARLRRGLAGRGSGSPRWREVR